MALADEIDGVRFAAPEGFHDLRLHSFGLGGRAPWPFPMQCQRLLVVSPFLTPGTLVRLPKPTATKPYLVSRADALSTAGAAVDAYDCFTLHPASLIDTPAPDNASQDDPGRVMSGLHAKIYVADVDGGTRWWVGSANATTAAFSVNAEVLLEMSTTMQRCGVRETMRQRAEGDPASHHFRDLLVPYQPDSDAPADPEPSDALDQLRRRLATIGFTATVTETDPDNFEVRYVSDRPLGFPVDIQLRSWPATTARRDSLVLPAPSGSLDLTIAASITTLSAFLVLELADDAAYTRFVVRCELIGAPSNRRQRIIAELIGDEHRLLRYLLALLTDDLADEAAEPEPDGGRPQWAGGLETVPLQEVMLKTLARDPHRLRDVAELIETLRNSHMALPVSLDTLWRAIWQVANEAAP